MLTRNMEVGTRRRISLPENSCSKSPLYTGSFMSSKTVLSARYGLVAVFEASTLVFDFTEM